MPYEGDLLYEMRKAFMEGGTAEEQQKSIQDAVDNANALKVRVNIEGSGGGGGGGGRSTTKIYIHHHPSISLS